MTWDHVFSAVNIWAMLWWAVLIVLPRTPFRERAVLIAGAGLLCLAYVLTIILTAGEFVDPKPVEGAGQQSFQSITGVRAIFASDGGVVIGWLHYLAFDLFVGLWIAKDADARSVRRIAQAPILLLTFLLGPAGLLTWLLTRTFLGNRAAEVQPG